MAQLDRRIDEYLGKRILGVFLRKRWLILGCTLACFLAANLYLRYAKTLYKVHGTLRIDIGVNQSFQLGLEQGDPLQKSLTEVGIITSIEHIRKVVQTLGLNVVYEQKGRVKSSVIFGSVPFRLHYANEHFSLYGQRFSLTTLAGNRYRIRLGQDDQQEQEARFGETITLGGEQLKLEQIRSTLTDQEFEFYVLDTNTMIQQIKENLSVLPAGSEEIFDLFYVDESTDRGKAILDELIQIYLKSERKNKEKSYIQQIAYIQGFQQTLQDSIKQARLLLEQYELKAEIPILLGLQNTTVQTYGSSEQQIKNLGPQLATLRQLNAYLIGLQGKLADPDLSLSFSNYPLNIEPINALYQKMSELVAERKALLSQVSSRSYTIVKRDRELAQLYSNLRNLVLKEIGLSEKEQAKMQAENSQSKTRIYSLPAKERTQKELQENYVDLEQKLREFEKLVFDLNVAKAAITSNSEIIRQPSPEPFPISPKRNILLYGSLILGFFGSISVILVIEATKEKLSYRSELEAKTSVPIIGEVARSRTREPADIVHVLMHPKSSVTESFRSLRSNIRFLLNEDKSATIAFTSTVSGEGKSYSSINFAAILSLLDRSVVLVDVDLRKPRLHKTFKTRNDSGLTSYLINQDDLDDIIQSSGFQNLNFIAAGPIPPNPAELINSKRFNQLISELKERYDYVVMDTSPVGMVTDALPIIKSSDICMYLFRADYSRKLFLKYIERIIEENRYPKIYVVFNCVNPSIQKYGYSYSYGHGKTYGYGSEADKEGLASYIVDPEEPGSKWRRFLNRWFT
ncbi:MAG: polysaccharide biosynthesis tyrosine autokinase [Sphingobacteriia bacterium]